MPSRELREIVELLRADPLSAAPDLLTMRSRYEGMAQPLPEGSRALPVDAGGVPAEWIEPSSHGAVRRTILFLHGGGYTMGSIATHRALAAHVAEASRARVLLPGYRLAPEAPFPAAIEDASRAYSWLLGQAE